MMSAVVEGQGALAASVAQGLADMGWSLDPLVIGDRGALVLVAAPDIASLVQRVRCADAAAIVIVVDGSFEAMEQHLLLASIEPLAVERAPTQRVSAVQVAPSAHRDDIAEAVAYLLQAVSVTGQIIRIDSGHL